MQQKKPRNKKPGPMTKNLDEENGREEYESEQYITRLAIQRKILKKFIDQESGQMKPDKK